ncbi:MAG: HEAT repeat domain-containing protein [Gemmataceae bacterium]|nr:HEAT repeat domain-containing protein [Gemmataceae bacterium]
MIRDEANPQRRLAALMIVDSQAGPNVPIVLPNLLRELAQNTDPAIRRRIISLLPRYRDRGDEIVNSFRLALTKDADAGVREAAAVAIPKLDRTAAVALIPDLANALGDEATGVRAAAAQTIGILCQKDAQVALETIPALISALKDTATQVRFQSAYALAQMGASAVSSAEALADMFVSDREIPNRKEAAKALAAIGPKASPVAEKVLQGLSDPHAEIRQSAAFALGRIQGDPERVLPALLKAARDADVSVRCFAVHAIGAYGKPAVHTIPELIDILRRDEVADVRLAVIEELASFGTDARPALEALRIASKDGRAAIREAALAAIKKIDSSP